MTRLHDKIREALENNPQLTQRGLAARMGLDPAAVNRMLYGRRGIMAEEIPIIEDYLGLKLTQTPPPAAHSAPQTMPENLPPLPVRNMQGDSAPIDWVARHPAQAGIQAAFAIYAENENMAPRYLRGETVYVHPHRPPAPPQDVVLLAPSGAMTLCRLLDNAGDTLRVAFFNPPSEETLPRAGYAAIYAVVGRG